METSSTLQYPYQLFGSASSVDLDICFFVPEIGTIDQNNKHLAVILDAVQLHTEKEVNANLAVVENGIIAHCFKGTPDELNNALYQTYSLHTQSFSLQIKREVNRDIGLKILRATRTIVSMLTRTAVRQEAKFALRNDLNTKINFLKTIQFNQFDAFGKNGSPEEVYKKVAFQIGQVIGLLNNKEYYTKETISAAFPSLEQYLFRQTPFADHLDIMLHQFIEAIESANFPLPTIEQ